MSKIKRNDPCPCGSGKKYKKCCMNKNVEGLGSVSLHEELNNHYSHLMAYVNRNYPNLAPLEQKETQEEEIEAAFRMVQKVFMEEQENGGTIFDEFFEKKKKKINRPSTLASMEEWKQQKTGIFKIVNVDAAQSVTVEDVWTKELLEVNQQGIPLKEENYARMPYCIGILLKWGPVFNFIPLSIPNYEESYLSFREQLEENYAASEASSIEAYLEETFIESLRKWMFMNGEQQVQTEEQAKAAPSNENDEVLELLQLDMDDQEAVDRLERAWLSYKEAEQPNLRKPEVVAAALEHMFVTTTYFREETQKVTKKAVAEKYGVSPSSMTNRINQLKEYFDTITE
ncbi:SEC-C domain-containing protein [Halobacillus sp. ACCC02827]|uniref:YecA family protein n=1 Tax=Halobacillus sp. ACCC02827 TaxID=3052090 RepID=UPI002570432F|nr:SEC-C domain-containing protein [Halobacillus sp. ACCC02827]WJE14937.1 SEC-C domain-containing protein [Halobacillus sp. ACCC02827]